MDTVVWVLVLYGVGVIVGISFLVWFIWALTTLAVSNREIATRMKSIASTLRSQAENNDR